MKQSERTRFMPGFGLFIGWCVSVSGPLTVNPCLMQTLRSAFIHTHCFVGLHGPYERRRRSRWHEGKRQDCVWQHPSDLRLAQRVRKTPAMHDAVSGLARAKGKFQMPCVVSWREFELRTKCCTIVAFYGRGQSHRFLCWAVPGCQVPEQRQSAVVMTHHCEPFFSSPY